MVDGSRTVQSVKDDSKVFFSPAQWAVVKDAAGTLSLTPVGTFGHGGRYGTYGFADPKNDLIGIFMIQREGGSDERLAFMELAEAAVTE